MWQVCESVVTPNIMQVKKTLTFEDTRGFPNGDKFADETFSLYGYDAFPLGGVDTACFCDWPKAVSGRCTIPSAVCADKNLTECFYELGSIEGHTLTQGLVDEWTVDGNWGCPENDFSDSWGIIPADSAHDWIQANGDLTVSMGDMLSFGMGGMRIGNVGTLPEQAKRQGIHPGNLPVSMSMLEIEEL
jgi:hypothetical protein